jgi:hypothetical protein
MIDGRTAALTCADPGVFPAGGGTISGTTAMRSNTVSSSCGGFVMNGYDAVYRVTVAAGAHIMVSVSGGYPVSAYVVAPCSVVPATPACEGNMAASAGNPIDVTTFVGQHYVVVDGSTAGQGGTYTLTVAVQ